MKLTAHRAHDYRHLIARWHAVAKASGLAMKSFAETTGHKLYFLKSKPLGAAGGVYISAGIHGDEPAATEALVAWAEKNARTLSQLPCILFPCLNPWGLANNTRTNEAGLDLNRLFHRDDLPVIHAVKSLIAPHHFDVALMLHEDYDAQGYYIYETERDRPFLAERLLKTATPFIPPDMREKIDGRKPTKPGIVRRRIDMRRFSAIGFPEAIYLHLQRSRRTFTVETPSEFALDRRVAAHVAAIGECVKFLTRK
jgi:murein peptide amidase A